MGDAGQLADRAALDEMERVVADMLATLGDPLPADESTTRGLTAVPERSPELPDLTGVAELLAEAEAGWAGWRQRLADLQRPLQHSHV